jgi:hypothetical protein
MSVDNVHFRSIADIRSSIVMSALPPKADIRCRRAFSNSKIEIGLVVYGYSNLSWAASYNVVRTNESQRERRNKESCRGTKRTKEHCHGSFWKE